MEHVFSPEAKRMLQRLTEGEVKKAVAWYSPYEGMRVDFPEGMVQTALQLCAQKAQSDATLNPLEALAVHLLVNLADGFEWEGPPAPPGPKYVKTYFEGRFTGSYSTDISGKQFINGLGVEMGINPDSQMYDDVFLVPIGYQFDRGDADALDETGMLRKIEVSGTVRFAIGHKEGTPLPDKLSGIQVVLTHRSQPIAPVVRVVDSIREVENS